MSDPAHHPESAADGHAPGHSPAGHAAAHAHGEHEEHIHEWQHYVKVWAALMVLFFISVTGPLVGIQWLTLITAFGIAIFKASMVVKYFMHLDVEKRFVHYFLVTSLMFMFLFFAAVAPDVMNHEGSNWVNVSAQNTVEAGMLAGDGHGEHGSPDHGDGHAPAPKDGGH